MPQGCSITCESVCPASSVGLVAVRQRYDEAFRCTGLATCAGSSMAPADRIQPLRVWLNSVLNPKLFMELNRRFGRAARRLPANGSILFAYHGLRKHE